MVGDAHKHQETRAQSLRRQCLVVYGSVAGRKCLGMWKVGRLDTAGYSGSRMKKGPRGPPLPSSRVVEGGN